MKVGVVSAYVPLQVKHLSRDDYFGLAHDLARGVEDGGAVWFPFLNDTYADMWLAKENPPNVVPNPVPEDRYAGVFENVRSNVVQHNRTEWALRASHVLPDVEVWCWLDFGIVKQGGWRNNKINRHHIQRFVERVARTPAPMDFIPFPGITEKQTVYPTGNVWRFCGSTHIWPTRFLHELDREYKIETRRWIMANGTTPLDLPIWALVEKNSQLPFRWYGAEYDASQLDNYPWGGP